MKMIATVKKFVVSFAQKAFNSLKAAAIHVAEAPSQAYDWAKGKYNSWKHPIESKNTSWWSGMVLNLSCLVAM